MWERFVRLKVLRRGRVFAELLSQVALGFWVEEMSRTLL
jgi:hypothetical protein